jgi:hypothetical protein
MCPLAVIGKKMRLNPFFLQAHKTRPLSQGQKWWIPNFIVVSEWLELHGLVCGLEEQHTYLGVTSGDSEWFFSEPVTSRILFDSCTEEHRIEKTCANKWDVDREQEALENLPAICKPSHEPRHCKAGALRLCDARCADSHWSCFHFGVPCLWMISFFPTLWGFL